MNLLHHITSIVFILSISTTQYLDAMVAPAAAAKASRPKRRTTRAATAAAGVGIERLTQLETFDLERDVNFTYDKKHDINGAHGAFAAAFQQADPDQSPSEDYYAYWDDRCKKIKRLQASKKDRFNLKDGFFFHAAHHDRDVIAFALFFPTKDANIMYLDILAVHPIFQGFGIGKKLLFSIFEQHPAVQKIIFKTHRDENASTRGFYEHVGCTIWVDTGEYIYYFLERK